MRLLRKDMQEPLITVGISPTAVQGVAIAAYSGRHSRMWTWDASTLKILGHQDIKARVKLRDVTDDGVYCAYYAEAHRKSEHYVAICRPPYFHALWLRNTFHLGYQVVVFPKPGSVGYCLSPKTEEHPWSRIIPEREDENGPFQFEEMKESTHREACAAFAARCSGILEYTDHWHWNTRDLPHWTGTDLQGRKIAVRGSHICADGVSFLDCTRPPFEAVTTPDWAKIWNPSRK